MGKKLTVNELARELRVHPKTVYRWVSRGLLPCQRIGLKPILFDLEEVHSVLRAHRLEIKEQEPAAAGKET